MTRSTASASHVLELPGVETLADLVTFVGRARRVDPDGAARLTVLGDVLAIWVSPVHGTGGPTVIGLRAVRLARAGALDLVVSLKALSDTLHRAAAGTGDAAGTGGAKGVLVVPPDRGTGAAWAGTSPPRNGWTPVGEVDAGTLAVRASAGVSEIVAGAPAGSGAAAVATLRARVWGRSLVEGGTELEGLPAGVALVAVALGFVTDGERAIVYRNGPWWRVTMARGHVLARRPALGWAGRD